ncbi:MAG: hypothetical protein ACE5HF_10305 [Gemmatimonadota bacterium]
MSKTRVLSLSAGAYALFALAGPAHAVAQESIDTPYRWIEKGLRAAAFGGYVSASRGVLDMGPGSTSVFGGRIRARVSSPLSLELSLGFGSSDRFVVDPELPTGPGVIDTVGVNWLLAEAGMQIALTGARTLHRFQPYIIFGAGFLRGLSEVQSDRLPLPVFGPTTRFAVNTAPVAQAGIGAEWLPGGRIGIGFEARDHLWRLKSPDGFFTQAVLDRIEELGVPAPKESEWTNNVELSVSIWYYF